MMMHRVSPAIVLVAVVLGAGLILTGVVALQIIGTVIIAAGLIAPFLNLPGGPIATSNQPRPINRRSKLKQ